MIDSAALPRQAFAVSRRGLELICALLMAILGAWLFLPALTPVHVEGFTASVASLALHLDRDLITNFDTLQPLNTEYFGLSKLGWVLSAAGLIKLGLSPQAALTLLSWAGLAGLCGASLSLVRRWTGAPTIFIVAGLLLVPGVSESAFFFNDNVPSAALAALALLALYLPKLEFGAAVAGLLFGLAVLTRADTILIGAAIPLILWERSRGLRPTLVALAIFGFLSSAVLVGSFAMFHVSIFDLLRVTSAAVAGWDRDGVATRPLAMFACFLGVPGIVLVACGAVALVKQKDWLAFARLLAAPLVFGVLLGSKLWEARQFLPLTPFFLALAIHGFRFLQERKGLRAATLLGVVGALTWLSLLGPAGARSIEDGPHALTGRLANIQNWREWQHNVGKEFGLIAALVGGAEQRQPVAIVADYWNEDRYTHLVLQEAGYALQPSEYLACAAIAERFVRGPKEVYLVRPHQAFAPYWRQIAGERLERYGLPCIDAVHANAVFLASSDRALKLFGPASAGTPDEFHASLLAYQLNPASVAKLVQAYRNDAEADRRSGTPTSSIVTGFETTRRRTEFHF